MPYENHFKHADDLIAHLNSVVPGLSDHVLKAKYIGFVSIAAVTVYELAIKEIFISFGSKKHKVLGHFTEMYFDRINGRIKLPIVKQEYVSRFGEKYRKRFDNRIEEASKKYLADKGRDMISSYGNLITWRNAFAHEGELTQTATYEEAIQAYEDGKEVIHCLASTMVR